MVLFQLPNSNANGGVELGMVVSVWRGLKNPRLFSGSINVTGCVAFRVIALEHAGEERS